MTKGNKSPQNYDNDCVGQTTAVHEQMIEENVHYHRAKENKGQGHVAIPQ